MNETKKRKVNISFKKKKKQQVAISKRRPRSWLRKVRPDETRRRPRRERHEKNKQISLIPNEKMSIISIWNLILSYFFSLVFFRNERTNFVGAVFPNVTNYELHLYPYAHIAVHDFLPLEYFNELERDFPKVSLEEIQGIRVNGKLYLNETPLMAQLFRTSDAYQRLVSYVNSMSFVNWIMNIYGHEIKKLFVTHNCSVNPDKAFIEYFPENLTIALSDEAKNRTRDIKLKKIQPPPGHDNNRLFSRIDLLHGFNGYYSMRIHEDLPHRLVGLLLHLDELHEHSGGAFEFRNPKNKTDIVKKIVPKRNMLMTHLSGSPSARHSVGLFHDRENPDLMRRSIHIQIAAHQNICREHNDKPH
jgi:hypothetical protein